MSRVFKSVILALGASLFLAVEDRILCHNSELPEPFSLSTRMTLILPGVRVHVVDVGPVVEEEAGDVQVAL